MSDLDPRPAPTTWSVRELAGAIGDRLRDAFPSEVWVRGEIQNLHRARSGHVYFTLCDHGDDETGAGGTDELAAAQLAVMLSSTHRVRVNRLLLRSGGRVRMTDGTEVRIRGQVDFYPARGQVQLRMASIDPAFTLGQLAAARAELLDRLRNDGLLDRNRLLPMAVAPLRVGLVTSAGSAAEADVLHELTMSGFRFEVSVADVRVQGPEAAGAVAGAVTGLARSGVDVVVVARGGGAATDLAAFDTEVVARAIATAARPVVTGIGHETDRSVADEVAHTAAKTPTAAAQFLVGIVATALDRAERAWTGVATRTEQVLIRAGEHLDRSRARATAAARSATRGQQHRIDDGARRLARAAGRGLDRADDDLDAASRRLRSGATRAVGVAESRLDVLGTRTRALDPATTLARGWSIVRRADGTLVRSIEDVAPGVVLRATVVDGTIESTVTSSAIDSDSDSDSDSDARNEPEQQ